MEWDPKTKILDNSSIDLGHQENARIWGELENYLALTSEAGAQWLRVKPTAFAIMDDLGYDDMDSFEATLGGTFEEWLIRLGCVELRTDENGVPEMRLKPQSGTEATPKSTIMKLPVKTREDLQVVCVKSPAATISIPEIEFEIGNDGKRVIDTLYNHISQALFQLENYSHHCEADKKQAIIDTVESLRKCLDLDCEWTWVVSDPSGMSELTDNPNVEIIYN
eukprot:TRINITY_DN10255_c0_g1_i1.p1 TRINITY_DN10255_c0_g1~~TRINITY_DN10255_c0_g1_i1.p1  ORF type:complete len:222 (-),score=60.99 TRINITY_DN10255_c0_g1_i1:87-752(-)